MSTQEVTEPAEILVCFTRAGTAAHALHIDCKTVLGPWINFTSAETLEKALRYLGATDAQLADHQNQMRRCGQGTSHIRLCCPIARTCSESTGISCKSWLCFLHRGRIKIEPFSKRIHCGSQRGLDVQRFACPLQSGFVRFRPRNARARNVRKTPKPGTYIEQKSGFTHHLARVLLISQAHKPCMPQMIRVRPFQKFNLCDRFRSDPDCLIHLLGGETLSPSSRLLLRQVCERAFRRL